MIIKINIVINKDTNHVVDDYCLGLEKLWPLAHYITINISSPNTPGLRDLQNRGQIENLVKTLHKRKKKTIKAVLEYEGPIQAPIKKGQKLGLLKVYISGELEKKIDILSVEDIKRSNIFSRLLKSLNYLVWGDV